MKWTQALATGFILAFWVGAGCSSSKTSNVQGGGGTAASDSGGASGSGAQTSGGGSVQVDCGTPGTSCESGGDCCSGVCATVPDTDGEGGAMSTPSSVCIQPRNDCLQGGFSCGSNLDCCTSNCVDGHCRDAACVEDHQPCSPGGDACCGGECVDGACADINGDNACKVSGHGCEADSECCSKLCQDGTCFAKSSYCVQSGDTCTDDTDCCGGKCDKTYGSTYGFCSRPSTSGQTGCNESELLAGELCDNDCSQCCSRSCAPNALGVFVCQLSGGCRPSGELCTKASDCCGGQEVPDLPGSDAGKPAECLKQHPDDVYGQCRQSGGCTPRGDTCSITNGQGEGDTACGDSSTSKPSNCCPTGNTNPHGQCAVDALFVPRCGVTDDCREEGETCASSADCCNLHPCVPDSAGVYRCGGECIADSGTCTVDADCCTGTACIVAPGEVFGTCGSNPPPDGGTGGGSSTECIPYGQYCESTSDCCNNDSGVTCLGRCVVVR